jgi:hypothetical protein
MSTTELNEFVAAATQKRLKAVCLDALVKVREAFATPIPSSVLEALGAPGPMEPSAHLLTGGRVRPMVDDFFAFDSARDRLQWVKELAFPSARYMRTKYPEMPNAWLPLLYVRRGFSGIARLISPREPDTGH